MSIRPLTFIGDRNPPDPHSAVSARRPILGSGFPRPDVVPSRCRARRNH
jgi:hypothetical protein